MSMELSGDKVTANAAEYKIHVTIPSACPNKIGGKLRKRRKSVLEGHGIHPGVEEQWGDPASAS